MKPLNYYEGRQQTYLKHFFLEREAELIKVYARRMKEVGHFDFVTWTRVMKPLADRSYFYLVYGTRHGKGLREFRGVERRFVEDRRRFG